MASELAIRAALVKHLTAEIWTNRFYGLADEYRAQPVDEQREPPRSQVRRIVEEMITDGSIPIVVGRRF